MDIVSYHMRGRSQSSSRDFILASRSMRLRGRIEKEGGVKVVISLTLLAYLVNCVNLRA